MTGGIQGPSADMKFAKYLALIVNKTDGYLGVYYGWKCGSLKHYPRYNMEEPPLTSQQHAPKGKAKATPGPGCKNQSRELTLDDEQPEIPPSPPPRVQSTSQQAITKGKGRATPRLGLKHQLASPPSPHQSMSQQAAPKGKGGVAHGPGKKVAPEHLILQRKGSCPEEKDRRLILWW